MFTYHKDCRKLSKHYSDIISKQVNTQNIIPSQGEIFEDHGISTLHATLKRQESGSIQAHTLEFGSNLVESPELVNGRQFLEKDSSDEPNLKIQEAKIPSEEVLNWRRWFKRPSFYIYGVVYMGARMLVNIQSVLHSIF